MEIANAGYAARHDKGFVINRPNGSGDYVMLVIRTEAFFILNGERIIAPANSIMMFKKGTPQIYGGTDGEFIDDWIHYEMTDAEYEKALSLGIIFDTVLRVRDASLFSRLIKNIFYEQYSKNEHSERSSSLYLELIILKLSENIKLSTLDAEGVYFKAMNNLRTEIYSNPSANWSINKICKQLRLSRSYVQHLYKSIFDTTIIADVTASRVEMAKYLLFGTDMSVSDIAERCGYNSDVHFMRLFKKATGFSPSAYRADNRISKSVSAAHKNKPPFSLTSNP